MTVCEEGLTSDVHSHTTWQCCLDHRQSPAGRRSVGASTDKRQLCRVPATLDHFVTVLGHHNARQPLHQITCRTTQTIDRISTAERGSPAGPHRQLTEQVQLNEDHLTDHTDNWPNKYSRTRISCRTTQTTDHWPNKYSWTRMTCRTTQA